MIIHVNDINFRYVLSSLFADTPNPNPSDIIGGVSLIIWTIFILVTIKYVIFILMADNHGEGGTFALCSLLLGEGSNLKRGRSAVILFTIVGKFIQTTAIYLIAH